MVIAQARITTPRASRYLVQLCRHANQMGAHRGTRPHRPRHADAGIPRERPEQVEADWSDTSGTIILTPWGRCTLTATAEALTLHVEATDTENLHRIQALLGWNLTRFGRRDQLTVAWQPDNRPDEPGEDGEHTARRGHRRTITLAATGALGVVLMIAVHLGVGGGALAAARWLGWTAAGLVITPILLVVGHAAIPMALVRLHRRRAAGQRSRRT
jgi:hypothetical protein